MQKDSPQKMQSEVVLMEEGSVSQTDLFASPSAIAEPLETADDTSLPTPLHNALLTDQTSLADCIPWYRHELTLRGKSNYTITCFLSDLKMFSDFVGPDEPVGRLSKERLTDWLMKLKFGSRGQVPAPKTMARRVTFLKNFFSWLAREEIIREDPAASLTLERPLPPLPELLNEDEVQALLNAATDDPRAHCLIVLILHAGLKKEEVMGLQLQHVDLSDPEHPLVTVHFEASTGKQHRERRLALPHLFTSIFNAYVALYSPREEVFECTDRNLNYILARVVKAANIQKRVTLQLLRDTFAVQELRSGATLDTLREKLGLSDEAWLESKEKYRRLAFPKV
ncbi:MAG TPA: tyrosine-type recombinase/integrase [Ktedonobacteraceae bacterium]|nr:tyrosine-type recombinase/integrase [Ktedonobacteraceae bacterium]